MLLYRANTFKRQEFTVHTVQTGWNSYHARNKLSACRCKTSRKHTWINIFKIPKVKSGIPEHKNGKKNVQTYNIFFLSWDCVLNQLYLTGYNSCFLADNKLGHEEIRNGIWGIHLHGNHLSDALDKIYATFMLRASYICLWLPYLLQFVSTTMI